MTPKTKTSSIEDRISDLETRIAFQDDTIDTLNKRIAEQEVELSTFHVVLQHINNKVQNAESGGNEIDSDNQPPPHY